MRPDGAGVHMSHGHAECVPRCFTERTRLIEGRVVKIYVDVVVRDCVCLFHAGKLGCRPTCCKRQNRTRLVQGWLKDCLGTCFSLRSDALLTDFRNDLAKA